MKPKCFTILLVLILATNVFTALVGVNGQSYSLKERNPRSGAKVESMTVPLTITVLKDGEPLKNAYVHFYVDDEWISGPSLTSKDGFAGKGVKGLEFGRHTWSVKVDKQGETLLKSDSWSFNYQPRPVLTLHSDYGETYGAGDYTYDETATFRIEPTVV